MQRVTQSDIRSPHSFYTQRDVITLKNSKNHKYTYDLAFVIPTEEETVTELTLEFDHSKFNLCIEFTTNSGILKRHNYNNKIFCSIAHKSEIVVGLIFSKRIKIKFNIIEISYKQFTSSELRLATQNYMLQNQVDDSRLSEVIDQTRQQSSNQIYSQYILNNCLCNFKIPEVSVMEDGLITIQQEPDKVLIKNLLLEAHNAHAEFQKLHQDYENMNSLLSNSGSMNEIEFLTKLKLYLSDQLKLVDELLSEREQHGSSSAENICERLSVAKSTYQTSFENLYSAIIS